MSLLVRQTHHAARHNGRNGATVIRVNGGGAAVDRGGAGSTEIHGCDDLSWRGGILAADNALNGHLIVFFSVCMELFVCERA